jgi:hypothetical protein
MPERKVVVLWNMNQIFKEKSQSIYTAYMTGPVAVAPGRSHLIIE